MNVVLFDDQEIRNNLLPLTFTRPVSELLMGILTMRERWERCLGVSASCLTQDYLSTKFPLKLELHTIFINASIFPNDELIAQIKQLKESEALVQNNCIIAAHMICADGETKSTSSFVSCKQVECTSTFVQIMQKWELFTKNHLALEFDFNLITKSRESKTLSETNRVIGDSKLIFLEEGAKVECAILNTTEGAIYIGKHAEIMEGAIVRGPVALCEHATIKMAAKIYGNTTIGRNSKVGGEVSNLVMFAYSNKAHDGFIGNSVIGEWCNLGADTNNSNLKNNYSHVKMWSYSQNKYENTGLQFCGLVMGDHSKCGINTMFNTGTVVGVYSNIFGAGFPSKHVPSFIWGGIQESSTYLLEKAFDITKRVYDRRHLDFTDIDKQLVTDLFTLTETDYN